MTSSPDRTRAALLLTNRLVPLGAKPLTAREFWQLVDRVDPADLLHADPASIAARTGVVDDEAVRYRTLLDAATAMSFEQERLADGGVSLMSALDDSFPARLRERLGDGCPPFLLAAGPIDWLQRPSLGVVGSRDADDRALDLARRAAELAVGRGWSVVSGLARGVDQAAMDRAHEVGGAVVGVPAEGISVASRSAAVRRRVHARELCLASPYAPDARFTAASALGRNKIVYALSQVTFVVAAADGTGGTWSGAKEALERRSAAVAVWAGEGAPAGNHALVRRGATPISDPAKVLDVGPLPPEPTQDALVLNTVCVGVLVTRPTRTSPQTWLGGGPSGQVVVASIAVRSASLGRRPEVTTRSSTTSAGVVITPHAAISPGSVTLSIVASRPSDVTASRVSCSSFWHLAHPVPRILMSMIRPFRGRG